MSIDTDIDIAAIIAAEEPEVRPDEPSLPADEWLTKNLFTSGINVFWTLVFGLIGLVAYRGLLNFVFSPTARWDAVRTNLRLLFTQAYPDSDYLRVWITVGIVMVLSGLSLGMMRASRGLSYKKILTWMITLGGLMVVGLLISNPTSLSSIALVWLLAAIAAATWSGISAGRELGFLQGLAASSAVMFGLGWWASGRAIFAVLGIVSAIVATALAVQRRDTKFLGLGAALVALFALVVSRGGDDAEAEAEAASEDASEVSDVAQTFFEAVGDRPVWWAAGLAFLLLGIAGWASFGDKQRRTSFVPTVPFALAVIGLFISSVWWYPWGHYGFADGEFFNNPGDLVAPTTQLPWTVMWAVLVAAFLAGRAIRATDAVGTSRLIVNILWLLSPFVTFWAVLRGPVIEWSHIWSTDLPLLAFFALGGGLLLWMLTRPGIGELGRLIAIGIVLFALYNWIVAFFSYDGLHSSVDWLIGGHFLDRLPNIFGWDIGLTHMLQKVRLSFLLLGLAALIAPNFIGDARQRLKLVYGWIGFTVVFHVLVTLINSASSIEVPTEDFAGGFTITIYVAVFGMLFSFPLGVILALARTSQLPLFRMMATVYIEAFRGVPFITMLFFFSVFVNLFLPEGMELAGLAAVTIALVLFSAAYMAENVRGGLQAIRRGQYEASDALGLTTVQRTMFIVLPQGLRVSIPPLVGQAISTYKETSLLAIVGIFDFLRIARDVIPSQTGFVGVKKEGLLFISLVYFIGSYAMSKYSQRLEKQLGVGER